MKVDFYVLENASQQEAWRYACQLIERIYADEPSIYVHTASQQEAERMDALMWTYQDQSFLPHEIIDEANNCLSPIQIGYQLAPKTKNQTLVNLTPQIPGFYQQFSHIIEIVFSDPSVQQLARERFRQYREAGCELNTHKPSTK